MSASTNSSGNQVPGLEFTPRGGSDSIGNDLMAEIARRLRVTGSLTTSGDGSASLLYGSALTVSSASGNQIDARNGIFVPLGAGLGVEQGNGLALTTDNKIKSSRRIFTQIDSVDANGAKVFTFPEQLDRYAVSVVALSAPGATARWHVTKTPTALTITFAGVTDAFSVETSVFEI